MSCVRVPKTRSSTENWGSIGQNGPSSTGAENDPLEPWFGGGSDFDAGVAESVHDLAAFLGTKRIKVPRPWRRLVG